MRADPRDLAGDGARLLPVQPGEVNVPGQRLLVVDYKRSKSTKRRVQMDKGFDSQASLYRAMIESGGPKSQK